MPTYDYMSTEPQCSLWRDTEGHCCAKDEECLYHEPVKHPRWRLIMAACVVASMGAWAGFAAVVWWVAGE